MDCLKQSVTFTEHELKVEMKIVSAMVDLRGGISDWIMEDSNWKRIMEILPWCFKMLRKYI